VIVHEGGYSEVHVPFCAHRVIERLAGSRTHAPDPLEATITARQPGQPWVNHVSAYLRDLAGFFGV
ncbi:MAG: class II histone deacetylase, partial [Paracoccus sp. (in: a-proteobacteria)]|nr:class II histone deacetylase [Paracoccus sp. (in: a-proteobacteria)]